MILYPLYIDPGTGSMLFSIFFGVAATLYFLVRALIIKAKLMVSGGRGAVSSPERPYVIYSEGNQYWNVFKPVLDAFEKRKTALLYLSSSGDDPFFSQSYRHIRGEFIGEGNRAFARLNLLSARVVLMTTPGLDVYQLKRSKSVGHYAHILHAPSDATMYRLFGIDYFDSILLTGDYQAKDIRTLEIQRGLPEKKLVTVGCSYLDEYAKKIEQKKTEQNRTEQKKPEQKIEQPSGDEDHPFTVLVSPSWGKSALLSKYGARLLDPLVKAGWPVIVRPHPQSKKSEAAVLNSLALRYRDTANLEWDYERENTGSLARADIMISDFSGIIFDYMFLFDKPVMYVKGKIDLRPYDAGDLGENPAEELWQFRVLREAGVELGENFDTICAAIRGAADNPELKAARRRAKEEAWQYRGEAGERIAGFMISAAGDCNA
ncbi:MAG: CDP-glycerol glycerophosphotransferase family protein [Treponema sp.]|jgi:hypothetical protein|nr:CDP-glycerol glycerophosphotransferase family protein [Treponema sp.]